MFDTISINEEGIDKLTLDILNYYERINSILNEIEELILSSSNCFSCEAMEKLVKKYSGLQNDINNFKYNIQSYTNDLLKVKKIFRQNATLIADDVRKANSNIQSQKFI